MVGGIYNRGEINFRLYRSNHFIKPGYSIIRVLCMDSMEIQLLRKAYQYANTVIKTRCRYPKDKNAEPEPKDHLLENTARV